MLYYNSSRAWNGDPDTRHNAGVAELADAQDLKSCGPLKTVPVRSRFPAPNIAG